MPDACLAGGLEGEGAEVEGSAATEGGGHTVQQEKLSLLRWGGHFICLLSPETWLKHQRLKYEEFGWVGMAV